MARLLSVAEKTEYAIRLDTSFDYTHRRFAPQTSIKSCQREPIFSPYLS
jgi:hypothetical protein